MIGRSMHPYKQSCSGRSCSPASPPETRTPRPEAPPPPSRTGSPPISRPSNSQLVTLAQESGGKTFVLSTVNGSLTMQERPEGGGTDAAVHATFRGVPQGSGATMNSTSAMLEPFAMPGMVITDKLTVSVEKSSGALFNVVPGIDGVPGSVSLELGARLGCFLVTPAGGNGYSAGAKVQVGCGSARKHGDGSAGFRRAASFAQAEPLRRYHPISFAARGGEEELPPGAIVHLEGRVLHHLL